MTAWLIALQLTHRPA